VIFEGGENRARWSLWWPRLTARRVPSHSAGKRKPGGNRAQHYRSYDGQRVLGEW